MLTHALTALVALSAPFLVRADVTPSEPGPGDVFRAGATCPIVWQGDTVSTTAWKDMAIELMTGDNFNMVHITTVTTGQDGTVDGRFEWPCPEMNPYSAIYFYQFSSPHTPNKTWVTRFTIASPTGDTTPPANATQPGAKPGDPPIPWGVGQLLDISKATPAPNFASTPAGPGGAGTGGAGTGGAGTGAGTGAGAGAGTGAGAGAGTGAGAGSGTTPSAVVSPPPARSPPTSSAPTGTPAPTNTGGAAVLGVDSRIFVAVAAVLSAAIAW